MSQVDNIDNLREIATYVEQQINEISESTPDELRAAAEEIRSLRYATERMRRALEAISVHADAQDAREGLPSPARIANDALNDIAGPS